ncbi:hypothetical protein Leryth_019661 [Lithospermum erythrorhizon]|nr:hypothetical protein Leryth_019661 [Lithospermum erythrorhizon]
MTIDLVMKPSCSGCGSTVELYGSNCKHLTLCVSCGKTMAQNRGKCFECGTPITRLIREYNVRACSSSDKNFFIGRFATGLPNFSKNNDNKWSLQKEGLPQGRQITDTLREKYKNKPWLLEDETGSQYHGPLEGSQSATYYLLMLQGREFVAIPAGSWYNFNKVAQYKQLTLEEAEEKMKNRRKTADGYERWMMKAANNGAAAFGEIEKPDDKEAGVGGGRTRKNGGGDEEGNVSDRGEEDEEEEAGRKNRLALNKRGGDDDEEGPRGGDLDGDDDDSEKGDDWEHEEIFTDDDEAVGNDPEEREDLLAPEIPAPPEIKQDDDDDEENGEEGGGGLSKSGKELKKLLGRANGMNESDGDDDDDDDDDDDLEDDIPVLAPKKEVVKDEPIDTSPPSKPAASGSSRATPSTTKTSKGKRKTSDDEPKSASGAPTKKVKTENVSYMQDVKPVKNEPSSTSRPSVPPKGTSTPPSRSTPTPTTGPVTEDEIRAIFKQKTPITTQDLVAKFKARLKCKEDKDAFAAILRKISKIQKINGNNYVVLRNK